MGGGGDGAVEALVALHAAAAGLDVGRHEGQRVVDAGEVVVGASYGGERGDLGLERVAGLDDLGQPVGVAADRLDDAARLLVARGHDGAVAVAYLDHADHLERHERLAQGGAADAEPLRELALGRELVAGLQAVVVDPRRDLPGHLLVEARAEQPRREGGRLGHGTTLLTIGSLSYWLGH